MASKIYKLKFDAEDRVSGSLDDMGKSTDNFSDKLINLGKMAAKAFAVKKVFDFGKASVDTFANYEKGMNEVMTLLPGASQETFDEMSEQVKSFSKEFGALPEKVVPALYQALSAGVPKENVFNFMEAAQKASVAGIAEVETSVDALSTVINTYGEANIDATKSSDLMFMTAKLGKTTFGELATTLSNVLPSASSAGIGFDQVSAALSTLTAKGVPTSVATNKLRAMIDELNKTGSQTDKIFRGLAGKSFKDFIGGGKNIQDALQLMEKHANKNKLGMNDMFSSIEAGGAALLLTGQGTEKFTSDLQEMANASGATEEAYAKMDRGLARTWERVKANWQVAMIDIGEGLAPIVEETSKLLLGFLRMFDGVLAKLKPFADFVKKKFTDIKDIMRSNADDVFKFDSIMNTIFGSKLGGYISKFAKPFVEKFSLIKDILASNADGMFKFESIARTVFGDKFVDVIIHLYEAFKKTFDGIMEIIGPFLPSFEDTANGLAGAIGWVIDAFSNLITKVLDLIADFLDFVDGSLGMQLALGALAGAFIAHGIIVGATAIIHGILKGALIASEIATWALETAQWALNIAMSANPIGLVIILIFALAGAFYVAYQKSEWFRNGVNSLWNAIKEGAETAINFAIGKINDFTSKINGLIDLINKIPGVELPMIPQVGNVDFGVTASDKSVEQGTYNYFGMEEPAFATGTKRTPQGSYIAGEEGPELIMDKPNATVFNAEETASAFSSGTSKGRSIENINLNFGDVIITSEEDEKGFMSKVENAVIKAIEKAQTDEPILSYEY